MEDCEPSGNRENQMKETAARNAQIKVVVLKVVKRQKAYKKDLDDNKESPNLELR